MPEDRQVSRQFEAAAESVAMGQSSVREQTARFGCLRIKLDHPLPGSVDLAAVVVNEHHLGLDFLQKGFQVLLGYSVT